MTLFVDSKWNKSESATMTRRKKAAPFFPQTNQTFQLGLYKANKVNRNDTVRAQLCWTFFFWVKRITHIIARRELKCKHIKSDVKQKVKYGYADQTIAMEKVGGKGEQKCFPKMISIKAFADIELYIWTNQQTDRNWVEVWLPTPNPSTLCFIRAWSIHSTWLQMNHDSSGF